jgi:hypothetical protein
MGNGLERRFVYISLWQFVPPTNGRGLATSWLLVQKGLLRIQKISLSKMNSYQHAMPLKEDKKSEEWMTYLRKYSCRDKYWLPQNCNSVTALNLKLMFVLLKTKLHNSYIYSIYGYYDIHGTVQTLLCFNVYFENGCQMVTVQHFTILVI